MKYKQKNIIANLFLKNGEVVCASNHHAPVPDWRTLVRALNDCGIDRIHLYDLSDGDEEHEKNLHAMKTINRISELPVYAGGNINRPEDIKKILYTGCAKVILNSQKDITTELAEEGASRFGRDKLALTIFNVDLFFKKKSQVEERISELIVLDTALAGTLENVTDMPYTITAKDMDFERIHEILTMEDSISGIALSSIISNPKQAMQIKRYLKERGILTGHLMSAHDWSEFKLNGDGLIPVIVQDYQSQEVLMLAYMNEEAFQTTLSIGKMTYYSRSRRELWTKGVSSGHYQYVKALMIDCDKDTILARVSQVGAACHTGNPSCFYTDLVEETSPQQNPLKVFENVYQIIQDRKLHPKDGSYTNYLFDKGLDKILKKVGEEATEIVIAAKNPEVEEIKYEIADFLYHMMVLMVEKNITWDEVLTELAQR